MELTESADILKLIIAGTNAGIWDWDFGTGDVYWSENFYTLLGYKQGEIPAQIETFYDVLLHPEDKASLASALNRHLKYQIPYKVEARLKTKEGGYRYFECSGKAVFENGTPIKMAGCNIDIHERKLLENKVAQSEYLLSEAGRVARMGGWEYDIAARKSIWSKTVYDIYELPYDYNMDDDDPSAFFLPPYGDMLKKAVEDCISNGTIWDLEMQMITAKKSIIWVRSYGEPLYNRAGELQKLRGVFMDIEKYKSTEIALNQSIELITQNNLQLKNFTHILSHNIRNHSNNIAQLTSLINTETLDEENDELIQRVVKVSQNLNTTLEDLSEAIKVQDVELVSDTLEFDDVLKGVLDILGSDIKKNGARINSGFNAATVVFPRIYLDSVITNLVSNAMKYRKRDVPPVISLKTYTDQNGSVVLECTDNGMGIDLDKHGSKIFGLYKTFHEHKDAHGVGLFLIKTQIESQGGQITIESQVDVGTTFKIVFKPKN
ncbi:MAG: PAS domain-containing sensor histidine kinase [Mucilaginibacter sp.]